MCSSNQHNSVIKCCTCVHQCWWSCTRAPQHIQHIDISKAHGKRGERAFNARSKWEKKSEKKDTALPQCQRSCVAIHTQRFNSINCSASFQLCALCTRNFFRFGICPKHAYYILMKSHDAGTNTFALCACLCTA